jgi:hypothetical protein
MRFVRKVKCRVLILRHAGRKVSINFSPNSHLAKAIAAATKEMGGPRVEYAKEKVAYAREFVDRMQPMDLDALDLRQRLLEVVTRIRKWNHLEPSSRIGET